ncbi:MAG TPA: hypothetical protein VFX92_05455, partial [Candidatus Krumholzibacteria bacterium]|nr:hypothetical protein [Candidatus Krumholzibacteria bacterium]
RLQSAHDIKLQISWITEGGSQAGVPKPVAARRRSRERLAWIIAAVAVLATGALAFVASRPRPMAPSVHAYLQPPKGVLFSSSIDKPLPLAISPDGTTIAFCARDGEGPDKLWVRSLGGDDAHALPGTEGAQGPFFSPDGKSLAFYADRKLRRIEVAGGPVIDLVDGVDPRGGSWNADDQIIFTAGSAHPIAMVAADGGARTLITALDSTLQESTHRYPCFLPDGKHFLFLARRAGAGAGESPTIFAGQLGSNQRVPVLEVASNVMYASGHLVYVRGTVLVAQRFDPSSLQVEGPAVPLVDDVRMDERFSRGVFAVSANGVLVCMTGNNLTRTQLRWLDRTGKPMGDVGEPADYTYGGTPNISPDGKSAVFAIANRDRGSSDVWIMDLASGRRRKLTVDTADHPFAVWLPGGTSAAVTTQTPGNGGIDAVAVDGTQTRRLVTEPGFSWPLTAWGDFLIYAPEIGGLNFATDLFSISIAKPDAGPQPFVTTKADESSAQFRSDGRFVAYVSNETGRLDVFVTTFPPSGGRWQVSPKGGDQPRWSRDGRELFFIDPENYLVSVEVEESTSGFQMGASHQLFQFYAGTGFWRYDVAPDGRFLVIMPIKEDLESPVTLITDWTRKMGGR